MNTSSLGLRWRILEIADREQRRLQERQNRRRFRAFMRRNINPFTAIPDSEFTKSFRLSKNGVRDLADDIISLIPQERRRDGIPPIMKILIALSFLATGSYQTLVGQSALHNVSQASVSRALKQVTVALNHPSVFKKYVKWPLERDERNFIKSRFYRKFKFPGLLGCIDGTHVAILRPAHHEERFFNRKGYHSLNVMIPPEQAGFR